MTQIAIGSQVPHTEFKTLTPSGVKTVSSEQFFANRIVLVAGVIGAFTPVCTKRHIPEFIPYAKELQENWLVDEICCICAADPFVLKAWAEHLNAKETLTMLTDTHAKFAEACGLALDLTSSGLGYRNTRYVMLIEDKVVKMLMTEAQPNDFINTSIENVDVNLKPLIHRNS